MLLPGLLQRLVLGMSLLHVVLVSWCAVIWNLACWFVQAGGVVLNDSPSLRVDSQPYGGLKDSGIQREGVKYAMEDMLEMKVLVMRNVGVL